MTAEEEFDIKNNHKKYPVGDKRRLTDIAKALTDLGEKHKTDDTPLGIAIRSQEQPILETEREINEIIESRLRSLLKKVEYEKKWAEENIQHEDHEENKDWDKAYSSAIDVVISLIQSELKGNSDE